MKSVIAIADDHPLISAATKTIIEHYDYSVLFEAENGKIFIDKLLESDVIPEMALLDMSMPIMDGKKTAQWLQKHYPQIKIIINTIQIDQNSFIELFEMGVLGYITKNVRPHILLDALHLVQQNKPSYPHWAIDALNKHYPLSVISKDHFSTEELFFLNELCRYDPIETIANDLNTSVELVLDYEKVLYNKLNVRTKNALIYFSIQNQLVDL